MRSGTALAGRRSAPPPAPSCTRRQSAMHCLSSSLSAATEALSSTRMMRLIRSSPAGEGNGYGEHLTNKGGQKHGHGHAIAD